MSKGSRESINKYLNDRVSGVERSYPDHRVSFAKLINANPEEIAYVPSTLAGENMVVAALGFPNSIDRIVTDGYHFDASLYMYGEFARQ